MKIKLTDEARLPTRGTEHSAGYDLYSSQYAMIPHHTSAKIHTGVSMEIPEGMVGLIWERSKLASRYGLQVMGGVIDSDYRGEIMISLYNNSEHTFEVKAGDRMAQLIFQKYESFDFDQVDELSDTVRGAEGINSLETRR